MKIILTIGYRNFLLPEGANVNAVLQLLAKAQLVEHERADERGRYVYVIKNDERETSPATIKMVDDSDVIHPPKRKAIPEKASADAHNTFGGGK